MSIKHKLGFTLNKTPRHLAIKTTMTKGTYNKTTKCMQCCHDAWPVMNHSSWFCHSYFYC